jgi:hypothetical protein
LKTSGSVAVPMACEHPMAPGLLLTSQVPELFSSPPGSVTVGRVTQAVLWIRWVTAGPMSSPLLFFRHQGFWVFHTPSAISKLKLPCQHSQFQCEILFQEVEWVYVCGHWGMSLCTDSVLGRSHVKCVGALEWMCVWSVFILCTPKIYSNWEESCVLRPQDFLGTKSKSSTWFKEQKKTKQYIQKT